jgi:hypothetical protein
MIDETAELLAKKQKRRVEHALQSVRTLANDQETGAKKQRVIRERARNRARAKVRKAMHHAA